MVRHHQGPTWAPGRFRTDRRHAGRMTDNPVAPIERSEIGATNYRALPRIARKYSHSSTTWPSGSRHTPYWPRGPLRISLLPPLFAQNTDAGFASTHALCGFVISRATKIKAIARGMLSSVRGIDILALGGGTTVANALSPSKGRSRRDVLPRA